MNKLNKQQSIDVQKELEGFEEDCKKMNSVVSLLWADPMYSAEYKRTKTAEHVAALKQSAQKRVDNIKAIVEKLWAACPIDVPNDGKNHAIEVNNALLAINILGANINAENLIGVLDPIRGSYADIKLVGNILRNKISTSHESYNPQILPLIEKYMMLDNGIGEFSERKAQIVGVVDQLRLSFYEQTYSNENTMPITCNLSYDEMNLPYQIEAAIVAYETDVKPGIEQFNSGKGYQY